MGLLMIRNPVYSGNNKRLSRFPSTTLSTTYAAKAQLDEQENSNF